MSARIHPHSPLPAPAMRASTPSVVSKSHVLAGVQDAYWSDDEAEDAECPLCLEEMDISDLNFKPCPCGYQICRFCWHHIKENLNGRCPACRREYTDEAVQFKPINKEDHKRLTQQKKQRERERKELDSLGRRQLANVRVVQRNVVYVVGIGPRFAKEELIPTLRSHEYFGQYGKISKILIVKRTPPGGRAPVVGLYITFHRREDAARCISAVDGAPSAGGGNEVMRASYGTTKYCMAFLRGASCPDHSCMNLHEWGDESDCFTKEDLTTLKHTMKDTETRARTVTVVKKGDETDAGLPRAASWANKGLNHVASTALLNSTSANQTAPLPAVRQPRRVATNTRQPRIGSNATASSSTTTAIRDRKVPSTTAKAPSLASSSRPATPASGTTSNRPVTPAGTKATKQKEPVPIAPDVSRSSTPMVDSDAASASQGLSPLSSPPKEGLALSPEPVLASPALPPGLPVVPPGLSAPPGLPAPSRTPISTDSSPLISMQFSQGSYQMSTQAQALVEDIKARREAPLFNGPNPFPDFDRMLQTLTADDGFSFNLDPKLVGDDQDDLVLPDFGADPTVPFSGNFLDAFPRLRQPPPPGLGYSPHLERPSYGPPQTPVLDRPSSSSSYTGSFNPFASENAEEPSRQYSPLDDDRKVSRFGFARGRQGSSSASVSSPLHVSATLSHSESSSQAAYYSPPEAMSPVGHASPQWNYPSRNPNHDYLHQPNSAMSSPLAQYAQAQSPYQQQTSRFQPFDNVSEAQLRDFINSSRDRVTAVRTLSNEQQHYKYTSNQPFNDPAIMSARMASPGPLHDGSYSNSPAALEGYHASQQVAYGPPPGLAYPQGMMVSPAMSGRHGQGMGSGPATSMDISQGSGSAHVSTSTSPAPSPVLSSSDFPALPAAEPVARSDQQPAEGADTSAPELDIKAQAKADRKAAKKAAADERAAARQKALQEKAAARTVEKERLALEKAAEKEKVAKEKAEKEKAEKERLEKARTEREQVEKEKAEKDQAKKAAATKASKQSTPSHSTKVVEPETPETPSPSVPSTPTHSSKTPFRRNQTPKPTATPIVTPVEPSTQAPILAKMPKKNKPVTKPIRIPKEDLQDSNSALASATNSEAPPLPDVRADSNNHSRSHSVDVGNDPMSLQELILEIDMQVPWMRISEHPFFDMSKINPAAKMPLEYGPLVHALSALSVGGGSFANNMPSGSIDNAVSSFQQLLETLTQTISDLLRLLPRTTWDDSSSFDGVLRDMLKGDDFLEDGGDDQNNQGREDEVAALTLALERRARWMEVQLSKLEELHRDINTAAVRAVLSFNDNGWDHNGRLPRLGNTLTHFDRLNFVEDSGLLRHMTAEELEAKLVVAKDSAASAEAELREAMQDMQATVKPLDDDEEY